MPERIRKLDCRETRLALALDDCIYFKNTTGERAFTIKRQPLDMQED